MTLISILAALAFERFSHFGHTLFRFTWFEHYLGVMRKVFSKTGLWRGIPGLILILAPILVAVILIYCLLGWMVYGLLGLILAIIILTYSLGPRDFYHDLEHYFAAEKGGDESAIKAAAANILGRDVSHAGEDKTDDANDAVNVDAEEKSKAEARSEADDASTSTSSSAQISVERSITKAIFTQFNQRIFAVLFWFVVLGPFGAVLYRVTAKTKASSEKSGSPEASILPYACYLLDILDWIPIRLAGLAYALVGDFHHGFGYWLKHVLSGVDKNRVFQEESGLIALHLNQEVNQGANKEGDKNSEAADLSENQLALALTDRTLILYLVVIALFVLGGLIY